MSVTNARPEVDAQEQQPLLLSVDSAAQLMGIGRTKAYEMVKCGQLPLVRIGTRVLIPREALEDWIVRHTEGALN